MKSAGPILNPRRNRWILARLYLTKSLFWLEKHRVEARILPTPSGFLLFLREKNEIQNYCTEEKVRSELRKRTLNFDRRLILRMTIDISDWFWTERRWKRQEMNYFPSCHDEWFVRADPFSSQPGHHYSKPLNAVAGNW